MIENKLDGSGDRLKQLRKALNKTQVEFSEIIKASHGHMSGMEKDKKNITESTIELLKTKFNINEHWLRHGRGEMFVLTQKNELDELKKKYNLRELDVKLIHEYLKLSESSKEIFRTYLSNVFVPELVKKQTEPQLTKEELDELEIQKELAEFEEAVRTQKNRDKNNLSNINYLENMDYFKEKKPA